MSLRRLAPSLAFVFGLVTAGCASEPPPPPVAAAPPTVADEGGAHHAAEVAFAALNKRNFDVRDCSSEDVAIKPEVDARAGAPIGDKCSVLVAKMADKSWLVVIRAATNAVPHKAGGGLALVTVSAGGEGVKKIDYAK